MHHFISFTFIFSCVYIISPFTNFFFYSCNSYHFFSFFVFTFQPIIFYVKYRFSCVFFFFSIFIS
uniref:Uncharacterized protein n=1 Tax=Rhizophagus irregularis (strain DAOM 181602 / DAOM 197198 / MUCL 43194) TaxID=747089 RepID=U9TAJ6_RHIID